MTSTKGVEIRLKGMVSTERNGFNWKEWLPLKETAYTEIIASSQKNDLHISKRYLL